MNINVKRLLFAIKRTVVSNELNNNSSVGRKRGTEWYI